MLKRKLAAVLDRYSRGAAACGCRGGKAVSASYRWQRFYLHDIESPRSEVLFVAVDADEDVN